jgi:hypothetical protein
LLGIPGLAIRSHEEKFLKEVEGYFGSLAPVIKPFLEVNGGPIRLLQVEN